MLIFMQCIYIFKDLFLSYDIQNFVNVYEKNLKKFEVLKYNYNLIWIFFKVYMYNESYSLSNVNINYIYMYVIFM